MADEFECPDCHSPFPSIPKRCGCGWENPEIGKRREQASVQRQSEYAGMQEARIAADMRIAEAKRKYGDRWRDELIADLKKEMRHIAIIKRREQRTLDQARRDKLDAFRKSTGAGAASSIFDSLEEFNSHVASLRAAGVKVKIIGQDEIASDA